MNMNERKVLRDEIIKQCEELKLINIHNGKVIIRRIKSFIESIKMNEQLYEKYMLYASEFRSEEEALYCIRNIDDSSNHLCPVCGNVCSFYSNVSNFIYRYKSTCGNKDCITSLIQSDSANKKRKQTNLNKYGSEYTFGSKEIQNKSKHTNQEKYGVDYFTQSNLMKDKSVESYIKHFGVSHAMKCQEVKDKVKKTIYDKYGEDGLSNIIKDKIKQTNIERYNREHISQIHVDHYDEWIDDDKFCKLIKGTYIECGSFLRLSDFTKYFNVIPRSIKIRAESLGLLDYFYIPKSNIELSFEDFLIKNNIKYKMHDRSIIREESYDHKEIDFLLTDNNIGVEINDISGHQTTKEYSPIKHKDKYYHLNKTISAKEKKIRLIHLWEWELRNEDEWIKISNWILNLLNTNKNKIGARKTIIKEVPINVEKEFLNQYHLQGYQKLKVCYGLYYDDELIQLMSFSKPRYNKNYQYELLRLCTKYGYMVIGGANKLLNHFIKIINPLSIISYCNLDKFDGKVYEELGFKLLKRTEPQIIWCNKEMKHFSQSSLNMIGADKMIKTNYGKGTNNKEIVLNHGYVPIYNCGLNVYEIISS